MFVTPDTTEVDRKAEFHDLRQDSKLPRRQEFQFLFDFPSDFRYLFTKCRIITKTGDNFLPIPNSAQIDSTDIFLNKSDFIYENLRH